jgi:precorrin-8X/cobalt-precorrin-8 methylmutase
MVQSGLRRVLLERLGLTTVCTVHDEETRLIAEAENITRSAAGIRRAWDRFGNNLLIAIGDAPTAVEETIRLILEQNWRPHLVVGVPVGFVGTQECKEKLRTCLRVPRITNRGTRGGSPWAAAIVNAMLIQLANERERARAPDSAPSSETPDFAKSSESPRARSGKPGGYAGQGGNAGNKREHA